jgi:hypothetical protein
MTNSRVCTPIEAAWVERVLDEARRDLIFLWHITRGKFGGPGTPASELPSSVERIVAALLKKGCTVGSGNPDSHEWTTPKALCLEPQEIPAAVVRLWTESPADYEFLVFVSREH